MSAVRQEWPAVGRVRSALDLAWVPEHQNIGGNSTRGGHSFAILGRAAAGHRHSEAEPGRDSHADPDPSPHVDRCGPPGLIPR
jgi:hypothetical protein